MPECRLSSVGELIGTYLKLESSITLGRLRLRSDATLDAARRDDRARAVAELAAPRRGLLRVRRHDRQLDNTVNEVDGRNPTLQTMRKVNRGEPGGGS